MPSGVRNNCAALQIGVEATNSTVSKMACALTLDSERCLDLASGLAFREKEA
jgi:hypothetical protein